DGSRVGGVVLKSRPVVSMKKDAALSLVLAPGGTTMFWVTQAGSARAAGMSDTAEINAPARADNMLLIFVSLNRRVLLAHLHGKYEERPASGQVAAAHVALHREVLLRQQRDVL